MSSQARLSAVPDPGDPTFRSEPELADKAQRADEGNQEHVVWCETCKENALPMRDGTCGFCRNKIADPQVRPVVTAAATGAAGPAAPSVEAPAPLAEPLPTPPKSPKPPPVLEMGENLELPLQAATESMAILAVKGAGKSNAAAVLVEELYELGIPWVVIDPKGDWWGIAQSELNPDGLPVVVLGGIERDGIRHIPLHSGHGERVVRMVVEQDISCVIDISHMTDDERADLLEALGNELFALHLSKPTPRHVVIEEAHEVVPQGGGSREVLKAWTRVVTQGRQRGLGITLVSQRSALVNKNVLTQTGTLFVLRTPSPEDGEVVRRWTKAHDVGQELLNSLPSLQNGECWAVAPMLLGGVVRAQFRKRWTHDSGATPEVVAQVARPMTAGDIDAFAEALNGKRKAAAGPDGASAAMAAEPEEELSPEATILAMVAAGPKRKGELERKTGLGRYRMNQVLGAMEEQGVVKRIGVHAGTRYVDASWEADEAEDFTGQAASAAAEEGVAVEVLPATRRLPIKELVDGLSDEAKTALQTLEGLDEVLERSGIAEALLRSRYLNALIVQVEAGNVTPDLLDRIERLGGFHS